MSITRKRAINLVVQVMRGRHATVTQEDLIFNGQNLKSSLGQPSSSLSTYANSPLINRNFPRHYIQKWRCFSSSTQENPPAKKPPFTGAQRLNHIAIAVPNLEEAADRYKSVLGISKVSAPHSLPEHGVRVVFVELENTKIELLEPLGESSPIKKFLMKNPSGGVHHICLEVPDVHSAIDSITSSSSVRVLDSIKNGAHGTPVVFLHPKDLNGVLTELEQVEV